MNFEEFRKLTPHTHLLLVKPHGYWAEASGVYMSASHLDLTISYGYNGIKGVELCLVFFPSEAVCAIFAHTRSFISSPDSNILFKCFVITLLSQSNNVDIAFCVHHTFSSL